MLDSTQGKLRVLHEATRCKRLISEWEIYFSLASELCCLKCGECVCRAVFTTGECRKAMSRCEVSGPFIDLKIFSQIVPHGGREDLIDTIEQSLKLSSSEIPEIAPCTTRRTPTSQCISRVRSGFLERLSTSPARVTMLAIRVACERPL